MKKKLAILKVAHKRALQYTNQRRKRQRFVLGDGWPARDVYRAYAAGFMSALNLVGKTMRLLDRADRARVAGGEGKA